MTHIIHDAIVIVAFTPCEYHFDIALKMSHVMGTFYNWQLTGFLCSESILIFQMFMICGDQHLYAWLQLCIFLELIYINMYKCGCKTTFTKHNHIKSIPRKVSTVPNQTTEEELEYTDHIIT